MKINFPNKDSVYMHDTPLKSLFGQNVRFESSGCVRVHNVEQVVAWILRDTPGWSYDRIVSMKQTGEQVDVKVQSRSRSISPISAPGERPTAWSASAPTSTASTGPPRPLQPIDRPGTRSSREQGLL